MKSVEKTIGKIKKNVPPANEFLKSSIPVTDTLLDKNKLLRTVPRQSVGSEVRAKKPFTDLHKKNGGINLQKKNFGADLQKKSLGANLQKKKNEDADLQKKNVGTDLQKKNFGANLQKKKNEDEDLQKKNVGTDLQKKSLGSILQKSKKLQQNLQGKLALLSDTQKQKQVIKVLQEKKKMVIQNEDMGSDSSSEEEIVFKNTPKKGKSSTKNTVPHKTENAKHLAEKRGKMKVTENEETDDEDTMPDDCDDTIEELCSEEVEENLQNISKKSQKSSESISQGKIENHQSLDEDDTMEDILPVEEDKDGERNTPNRSKTSYKRKKIVPGKSENTEQPSEKKRKYEEESETEGEEAGEETNDDDDDDGEEDGEVSHDEGGQEDSETEEKDSDDDGKEENENTDGVKDFPPKSNELDSDQVCFKCGSTEHLARKCKQATPGYVYADCFICSKKGHLFRMCPEYDRKIHKNIRVDIYKNSTSRQCYKCGSTVHMSSHCTVAVDNNYKFAKCYNCGKLGHMSRHCPDYSHKAKGNNCYACGAVGHKAHYCPSKASA